jgi:exosortase F-associated protein
MKARLLLSITAIMGLLMSYLFQDFNIAMMLGIEAINIQFVFNKISRFILNDGLLIVLIYSIFREKRFVMFALLVQAFGFVFILIPYLILKIEFHSSNGPLVSFLHRLVLNPILLLLLIPSYWFIQKSERLKNNV